MSRYPFHSYSPVPGVGKRQSTRSSRSGVDRTDSKQFRRFCRHKTNLTTLYTLLQQSQIPLGSLHSSSVNKLPNFLLLFLEMPTFYYKQRAYYRLKNDGTMNTFVKFPCNSFNLSIFFFHINTFCSLSNSTHSPLNLYSSDY